MMKEMQNDGKKYRMNYNKCIKSCKKEHIRNIISRKKEKKNEKLTERKVKILIEK